MAQRIRHGQVVAEILLMLSLPKLTVSGAPDEFEVPALKGTLDGHRGVVVSVAFSRDGVMLASGAFGQVEEPVLIWNVRVPSLRCRLPVETPVLALAMSPAEDAMAVAALGAPDCVSVERPCWGRTIGRLGGDNDRTVYITFSRDGEYLVIPTLGNDIGVWNARTLRRVKTIRGHAGLIRRLVFARSGKFLASASDDGTMKIWRWRAGSANEIKMIEGHQGSVHALAYSPDGLTLASGGADKTVRLWTVESGAEQRKLIGHTDCVLALAYSPDGTTVASGALDGTIRSWSIRDRRENATLRAHTGGVYCLAYSPDGNILVSGGADGKVRIWSVSVGKSENEDK